MLWYMIHLVSRKSIYDIYKSIFLVLKIQGIGYCAKIIFEELCEIYYNDKRITKKKKQNTNTAKNA